MSLSARGGLEHFAHEVLYGIEQDETHLSSPYPQALRADGQGQRDTGAAASELRPLRCRGAPGRQRKARYGQGEQG